MYMRLSSTHMTDSTVWLSNELANVLTRPYYLSETPADEFDRSKVGRVKNGKYIIVLSTGTLGSKCSVYRIHHLRDDALVIESIKNGVVTAWMPVDY